MNVLPRKQHGYIALVALLIVAVAGLTIGLAVSLRGIAQAQLSLSDSFASQAKRVAEACVEDGLERLRHNFTGFSGSLSVDGNLCTITTTVNNSVATLVSIGTVGNYTQKINMQVDVGLNVLAWQEE